MQYKLLLESDKAVLYSSAGSVARWEVKTQFFRGKRQVALLSESGHTFLFSNSGSLTKLLIHRFPFLTEQNLSIESTGDFA